MSPKHCRNGLQTGDVGHEWKLLETETESDLGHGNEKVTIYQILH